MRERTIYRFDRKSGEVLKIPVGRRGLTKKERIDPQNEVQFHQNILDTFYELECEGGLPGYTAKQKDTYKRVHTYAQEKGYWESDAFGYQGPTDYALDKLSEEGRID